MTNKEKYYKLGNRLAGLSLIILGGVIASATKEVGLEDAIGLIPLIEGTGDLISGKHHYISSNLLRYFSKGKIDIRYRGDPKYQE